jgi:hypothetical protein
MSLPNTIHTAVGQALIGKVSRLFNGSVSDVLLELLQNARRAGGTRVEIDRFDLAGRPTLVIRDDGAGIDDPTKLVTLGESGWHSEIANREDPVGMGIFSLAGRRVEIRSFSAAANQGWRVVMTANAWESGQPLPIDAHSIACGTEILIEMPKAWDDALAPAAAAAAKHYPLAVRFGGTLLDRADFLSGAQRVEEWNGCRIGVFHDRELLGSEAPRINFHGVTVRYELPVVHEIEGQHKWHARVDIVDAPALKLVLPARKEMVRNAALAALHEAAEQAIYRAIAANGSHRLPHTQWLRAASLGIALPEAEPWLCAWRPRIADSHGIEDGDRVAGEAMVLMPTEEPHIEQCAHRVLGTGRPLGGTLVREVHALQGYAWYDELPRVTGVSFHVDSDAGIYDYNSNSPLPEGIESGRVGAITLEIAVSASRETSIESEVLGFRTDILIAPDKGWCPDIEMSTILLASDTTMSPMSLAVLLDMACFSFHDDCDNDSWQTQHSYFEKQARNIANEILLGEETAIIERIRDALQDEVSWLIPEGRKISIVGSRKDMTVAYVTAPDGPSIPAAT